MTARPTGPHPTTTAASPGPMPDLATACRPTASGSVSAARRALGIPTLFNRLGPLCNPAPVRFQVAGAPSPALARTFADVLGRLGVRRGVAMASADGCDEFSPRAPTAAYTWTAAGRRGRTVHPQTYLARRERTGPWTPLAPPQAALETERILRGGNGARRGAVVLTSGIALWLAGTAGSVAEGVTKARAVLDDGRAAAALAELRELAGPFREASG